MIKYLFLVLLILVSIDYGITTLSEDLVSTESDAVSVSSTESTPEIIEVIKRTNCNETTFCPETDYGPHSAYVPCHMLSLDFIECQDLLNHQDNQTSFDESGIGCLRFGGQNSDEVLFGSRHCQVLDDIECYGSRTFIRQGFPCIRHNGHYFVTTLLFSLLLGFLGMDRFYLGHTGTAIGKMLTIGGVGIWWIVDIVLLVTGNLMPEDGSNWMPFT